MANTYLGYGQNDTGGPAYPPTGGNSSGQIQAGTIFTDGYKGLAWCKTIWLMIFGFFDRAMSTPYSGQLYPTGSAFTTNGQASPVG